MAVVMIAKAKRSILWYRNSAPLNTLLMKYTGFSPPSKSSVKTELIVLSDTDK